MRILADENVSHVVIVRLRASGFDVASIAEDKSGVSDEDVLKAADSDGCILITEDRDFGELVIRQQLPVRGIILLETERLSNALEADRVNEVVSNYTDRLVGNLIVIEPGRLRIRPLPQ